MAIILQKINIYKIHMHYIYFYAHSHVEYFHFFTLISHRDALHVYGVYSCH